MGLGKGGGMFSPRTGSVHENQSHDASVHSKPGPQKMFHDFPPSSLKDIDLSDAKRRMSSQIGGEKTVQLI